jgi:hypothetical protein
MGEISRDPHLGMRLELLHKTLPPPPPKKKINSEYRLSRTNFKLRTMLLYFTNILAHSYVTAAPNCFPITKTKQTYKIRYTRVTSGGYSVLRKVYPHKSRFCSSSSSCPQLLPPAVCLRKCKRDPQQPWVGLTRQRNRTADRFVKAQCGSDI